MDIPPNALTTVIHSFLFRERVRIPNDNLKHEFLQILWLLLGFVLLAISVFPMIDGDGYVRYQDLINIVSGKKPNDKFSSIQMVLSMPLYYFGQLFGQAQVFVGFFNFVIFFVTSCALSHLLSLISICKNGMEKTTKDKWLSSWQQTVDSCTEELSKISIEEIDRVKRLLKESNETYKASLKCDCGGKLERDLAIYCPTCKSHNLTYKMRAIT